MIHGQPRAIARTHTLDTFLSKPCCVANREVGRVRRSLEASPVRRVSDYGRRAGVTTCMVARLPLSVTPSPN